MLCLNDMPFFNVLDNATIQRIKIYEYKLTFIDKPVDQLEPWERVAIPMKNLFDEDAYKDAYFWIIMDAYATKCPEPPLTALATAKEWIPVPKANFVSCLQEAGYQIIKGSDEAYTPFSELKEALKNAGVASGMSDQAIGRELTKLGLESSDTRINGKKTVIRKFIRKMDA